MNKTLKKKLCWNCEGNVTLQQENCPYCGVYLSPSDGSEDENSLLPPYRLEISQESSIPSTPYQSSEDKEEESAAVENSESPPASDVKALVLPLSLLLIGVTFGLFALLLVLFSKNGYFTLSWDADLWYVYLIIAIPAFIGGYRSLIHSSYAK